MTDNRTGLMWQKCPAGSSGSDCSVGSADTYSWAGALQYAQTLNASGGFANFSDWRLPNTKELESLVEEACYDPAINISLFPNNGNSLYWSSSPRADAPVYAWAVKFDWGATGASVARNYSSVRVRLVRSVN